MRKMKKVLSLAMTAAMTASLLTGMGAVTASAKKSDDGKRTKITALLKGTESTEQYKTFDYLLKNFCDEKGLDYEIELVNDMQDYFTKLQMYINSDTRNAKYGPASWAIFVRFPFLIPAKNPNSAKGGISAKKKR